MQKLLTTKDLSLAIGVSESSLRRWTDSGAIQTSRTPGGHRRIPLSEAIRFIRETHATVIKPDILGLPQTAESLDAARAGQAAEQLHAALVEGRFAEARGYVVALYLGGMSVAMICDGPIRTAMHRVGELWRHGGEGILVEHQVTSACGLLVSTLRQMLPEPGDSAPLAIGGTPPGDPYLLPSAMAATVLAEAGWRENNFGPEVPLNLLADAARARRAGLVWLSVSSAADAAAVRKGVKKLAEQLSAMEVALVIGGQRAAEVAGGKLAGVQVMQTMAELSAFARGAARERV